MGYRSDIAIAWSTLTDVKARLENPKLTAALDDMERHDYNSYCVYYRDQIKWYEGYPEVDTIEAFIKTLDGDDFGYIRIGENDDDIEYKGAPYDYGLQLNRSIGF